MGLKNKIYSEYKYFLTLTVVDWVDVFTKPVYKHIIVDSLKFSQERIDCLCLVPDVKSFAFDC
jgi:hypothetical protein